MKHGLNSSQLNFRSVQPSAVLAICTAVANQALRFAAYQGVAIAWWFSASRGTSLRQLHTNWRAGTTFMGALIAGRNMGLIGLACIFSTLVAIDGPLLQKATTVVNARITDRPLDLNVSLAPEIPRGYTGGWMRTNMSQLLNSPAFNYTMPTAEGSVSNNIIGYSRTDITSLWSKPWFEDVTVPGIIHGCPGVCNATVKAPALAQTVCTRHDIPVNYTTPVNLSTMFSSSVAPPLDRNSFLISGGLLLGDHERLNLITAFAETEACVGELEMTVCTLEPAIGEYDVEVDHGKVTLLDASPRIIALANNTKVDRTWDDAGSYYPSTLGGVSALTYIRYESAVSWFVIDGEVEGQEYGAGAPEIYALADATKKKACSSYGNPRSHILKSLNKLMFNIGAVAAREDASYLEKHLDPGLSVNTTITGYLQGHHNVFHTNLRWFAAAAAVEALCIALILPTYIGFWRLGRPMSFSPLEVAKVSFRAVSLQRREWVH
jgi:hypothetical protein